MLKAGIAITALALSFGIAASAEPRAELIHFTEDGGPESAPLLPDFEHHSIWSAMGQAADGTIYLAVSNHRHKTGNVVIYALDPATDRLRVIDDLKSVSERAGNWLPDETQYKVHSFMPQHGDGRIYFTTMVNTKPGEERGAHLYALDPATDMITDVSATAPYLLRRDGTVGPNSGEAAMGSGVATAGLSIKGIGLNPDYPDALYGVTNDLGYLIRIDTKTGEMANLGPSAPESFILHVDRAGDVYYVAEGDGGRRDLRRYDPAAGESTVLQQSFTGSILGMATPRAQDDLVALLTSKEKQVYLLDTERERVFRRGEACGTNWWQLFNMTASPDGEWLYFLSNNNDHSVVWRSRFTGGTCQRVLGVNDLLGSRNLSFGGVNVWHGDSFYLPVWTHEKEPSDLAILKVTVR